VTNAIREKLLAPGAEAEWLGAGYGAFTGAGAIGTNGTASRSWPTRIGESRSIGLDLGQTDRLTA
jgi:hypothetical protein